MTGPMVCDRCGDTDCGPFATVTGELFEGDTPESTRLLGKRCLDELGIKVDWGPMYRFRIDPEKSLTPDEPSTIRGTLTVRR